MQSQESIASLKLPDGTLVRFRPVRPDDEPLVSEAFRSASRETRLHRFFTPVRELSREQLRRMLIIDPAKERCVVGLIHAAGTERIIAGVRYVRTGAATAEIAITVHDDFHRRGIGTFMLRLITDLARRDGIASLEADVMDSNTNMLQLLEREFPKVQRTSSGSDVVHLVMPID